MERLFNLDPQLLHDAVLLAVAVLVMFTLLSYLLFNPVREFLAKRQERIKQEQEITARDQREAALLKQDYEARIRDIEKEAEQILSDARKKSLEQDARIVAEAKEEAARIIARAEAQTLLEQKKAADNMKQQMIEIARMMAEKSVAGAVDVQVQETLVNQTLEEIGEDTWLS